MKLCLMVFFILKIRKERMELRIVSLSDQDFNNLMVFLDRVPIQGHQERGAMNQLVQTLSNPIKTEGGDESGAKNPGSDPIPAGPA